MPLPKDNRLSLRFCQGEFKSGQKFYSKHFTIVKSKTPRSLGEVGQPQFSILVSKKTAKHAVDRNRIRRLTSSAIQSLLSQFSIGQFLILPKSTLLTTPFSEILTDLFSLLLKIKNNTMH